MLVSGCAVIRFVHVGAGLCSHKVEWVTVLRQFIPFVLLSIRIKLNSV
jgi:hypothetical protein